VALAKLAAAGGATLAAALALAIEDGPSFLPHEMHRRRATHATAVRTSMAYPSGSNEKVVNRSDP